MTGRKTVTRTTMGLNGPKEEWSLTLGRLRFWSTLVAMLFMVIGGSWAAAEWTGKRIFQEELKVFHAVVRPQIKAMINEEIEDHQLAAQLVYQVDIAKLTQELALIRQHSADMDERFGNMEMKIDRLYYARFGDG